jgi:hypothetical protein
MNSNSPTAQTVKYVFISYQTIAIPWQRGAGFALNFINQQDR